MNLQATIYHSSNVRAATFVPNNPESTRRYIGKGTLTVTYWWGDTYTYPNQDVSVYYAIVNGPSPGRAVWNYLRR